MKTTAPTPAATSKVNSSRAPRRASTASSKRPAALRGANASTRNQSTPTADPALPTATQGTIRMDVTNLSPAALLSFVQTIKDGLTGNMYSLALRPKSVSLPPRKRASAPCFPPSPA